MDSRLKLLLELIAMYLITQENLQLLGQLLLNIKVHLIQQIDL